ncbi:MAG TPA: RHS repeat domain-containing protein, partial [Archangium sp.]|nr:RHS repeat domain-containing protein [Archangium sp.]
DAEGRLLRRVDGSDQVSLYSYDAAGRLERVTRSGGGQEETTVYRYDEAGRVLSIDSGDACDRDLALCERYTYWPNGQPRQISRWSGYYWSMDERYDESGRLSSRSWGDYDVGGEDLYTYDAAGRLSRYWVKDGRYIFNREAITTSVYDSRGLLQLQRYAEDNVTGTPPVGEPRPEVFGHIRLTRRVSYICGTQIVALDEWDSDEDGVVDARRTHERDATGRLVRERYSGTPRLDKEPIRRDFSYECD